MPPISRRRLLTNTGFAAAGILAAAGIGSAVAAISALPRRAQPTQSGATSPARSGAPAPGLVTALRRERQLLAQVATLLAATPAGAADRALLVAVQADHQDHADALLALIVESGAADPGPSASSPATGPTMTTLVTLKAAEQDAQDAATADATLARGATAVLLASIAACEAGHVQLLA